jgi:hypothetical protein
MDDFPTAVRAIYEQLPGGWTDTITRARRARLKRQRLLKMLDEITAKGIRC